MPTTMATRIELTACAGGGGGAFLVDVDVDAVDWAEPDETEATRHADKESRKSLFSRGLAVIRPSCRTGRLQQPQQHERRSPGGPPSWITAGAVKSTP